MMTCPMTITANATRIVHVVPMAPIMHSAHAAHVRQRDILYIILILQISILLNYLWVFYRYNRRTDLYGTDTTSYYYILTKKEFQSLPHRKVKAENDGEECPICMCQYIRNQRLRVLPCSHYYHTRCIERWLTKMSTLCPMCRYDLTELYSNE